MPKASSTSQSPIPKTAATAMKPSSRRAWPIILHLIPDQPDSVSMNHCGTMPPGVPRALSISQAAVISPMWLKA